VEQTALMSEAAPVLAPRKGSESAEFTVNNRELLKELAGLQRVVPRKNSVPILGNIHIQATNGALFLTASDTNLSLRSTCPARVKREGRLTLPAHKLHDYARLLEDGDVSMRMGDNNWVQIKSGRSHTRMAGMPADTFPSLPLFPAAGAVKLEAEAMRILIAQTLFAACLEESRYLFNGALLKLTPEGITMVATDGHRLAHAECAKPQTIEETRVLIPKRALIELGALLGSAPVESIQFAQDASTLYFVVGSRLLTCQQIAGKFPNYEAVLPQSLPHKAVLSRHELLLAIQRVAQFADEKSSCVRIVLSSNEFKLASSSSDSCEAEDVLPANYAGEQKAISFNSHYLLDFLKTIDCENVRLEFKDGECASEFKPEESADKSYCYRYVVMPLRT
jgi:DNA polymerase-3 subunit beta